MNITKKLPLTIAGFVVLAGTTAGSVIAYQGVSAHDKSGNDKGQEMHQRFEGNPEKREEFKEKRQEKQAEKFKSMAEVLGVSVEEIETAHKDKGGFEEFVESKGMSIEDFHAKMQEKFKAKLQEEGLSEDEINKRVERNQKRFEHRKEHRERHEQKESQEQS